MDKELKYIEYDKWFADQIAHGLQLNISEETARQEYEMFKTKPGRIDIPPINNKAVLYFQEDNFYHVEKEMFSTDSDVRHKLIANREKYLGKSYTDITDAELLRGFKISGIHQSYSHFSPLWTKWFAETYGLTYVADPFGGWGHHMLGVAAADCKYVYNDLSHSTVDCVRQMKDFFGINAEIIEGDAREFIIPYACDSVFMCPPYYNTEIYECGEFADRKEFNSMIKVVLDNCAHSNAKTIGVIVREDFEELFVSCLGQFVRKEIINVSTGHFNKSGKMHEYFYIWEK